MMNGYVPSLAARAIEERRTWQYRAIAYTHGNKSRLGRLIIAILGRFAIPPCFHPTGVKIALDGRVLAMVNEGLGWRLECIYDNVQAFTDVFRGLADAIELSDDEREAMFAELRKFVFKDERATSGDLFN